MKQDAASLDRLHDLALPPEPSWWPLAPGWYVVIGLLLLALLVLLISVWRRWRANGYRRAALGELTTAQDPSAIAELLRRTALATTPRTRIAGLTGAPWIDWLEAQCPGPMPDGVRAQLTQGVYGPSGEEGEVRALRQYAAEWITRHRALRPEESSTPC